MAEHDGRRWTAVTLAGKHWEIRDLGDDGPRRFSVTVAHWDRPDWWAATLDAAKDRAAEVDGRPPIPQSKRVVERAVVTPEAGDEYVAYTTSAAPPEGTCECGSAAVATAVKPRDGSAEWWDDPHAFWRCPGCGGYRGDIISSAGHAQDET